MTLFYRNQFKDFLFELQERQKLSEGNRDHERLKKLDALKPSLSYHEWERDFEKAEEYHLCYPDVSNNFLTNEETLFHIIFVSNIPQVILGQAIWNG